MDKNFVYCDECLKFGRLSPMPCARHPELTTKWLKKNKIKYMIENKGTANSELLGNYVKL